MYCNQCKKMLDSEKFELKKDNINYYTRCITCRSKFNIYQKNKYNKTCSRQTLCNKEECDNCYNKSFASYQGKTSNGKLKVDCWHKDNELKQRYVFKSTGKKFKFKCDVCNHNFLSSLDNVSRLNNSWCSYCSNKKLCNKEDCEHCYNKSFASYQGKTSNGKLKVDCWHKDNKLKPRKVFKSCNKKFKFNCDVCNHNFSSWLAGVSGKNNNWCPYCSNPPKTLCNKEDCDNCYNNSFASYEGKTSNGKLKVDCWHKDNELKPRKVFKSSGKKIKFNCDVCNHNFSSSLNNILRFNNWCPYCSNQTLCNKEECEHCYNNSFASYKGKTSNGKLKIDCWHKDNKLKPRYVFKSSGKKLKFNCDVCNHNFLSSLNNISGLNNNWCPKCTNKTELKLYNWLLEREFIKKVNKEFKPKWCSTIYTTIIKNEIKEKRYQYRYDFLITFNNNNKQLIIELDGAQHFVQVSNWKTPLHNQIRDKYKEKKAKQKKLKIVRCMQEDVLMERNNWEEKLMKKLNKYIIM